MRGIKVLGCVALGILVLAVSLLVMVGTVEAHFADGTLIGIAFVACLIALIWGAVGAKLLPKWLFFCLLFPIMTFGICVLMAASERYPPLSPFAVGIGAAVPFAILGCAVSWRSLRPLSAPVTDSVMNIRSADILAAGAVYLFVGIVFFQPLIILLNGRLDVRPPLVFSGKVEKMYQTHGKGAGDYVVLSGPAAAYHSTWAQGEFEVPAETYRSLEVGAQSCLVLHTGRLRFHWWLIKPC